MLPEAYGFRVVADSSVQDTFCSPDKQQFKLPVWQGVCSTCRSIRCMQTACCSHSTGFERCLCTCRPSTSFVVLAQAQCQQSNSGAILPAPAAAIWLPCLHSWVMPPTAFQAYSTWAPQGYLAHLAVASAWMCKYSATYCPVAEQYFSAAMQAGLQYSLGYDWDSTLPQAAVLLLSMNMQTSVVTNFLETLLLAKWEVIMHP